MYVRDTNWTAEKKMRRGGEELELGFFESF